MLTMESYLPIFAGLAGTFFMSAFTEIAFIVLKKDYHVVRILGNMFMFRKTTPLQSTPPPGIYITALAVHYAVGIVFAYMYYWLRDEDILNVTTLHWYHFGICIATIAILGWKLFFEVHPGPPTVQLKYYLPVIWLGHIILAFVVKLTYQTYLQQTIVENIPACP